MPMKQGRPVINLVMFALAAALTVYFGLYLYNSLNTPFSTTLAYQYTLYDSVQVEGLLVRDEQVLHGQSGIVEVTRSEGERVGSGQTVAMVYRDSQAQENQAELDSMRMEYDLLTYAMTQTGDVESAAKLDEGIIQATVSLRDAAARNDYSDLEQLVVDVKSGILKRGYTYRDGVTSDDLEARRAGLKQQIADLSRQTARDVVRVRAPHAGTFSNLVDGMEGIVTPANVAELDPAGLTGLIRENGQGDGDAVGKLILGNRWSYAAVLPLETAQRLREGEYATLRFSGDFNEDVTMRVDHLGHEVDGQVTAVFSSDRFLSRTSLLRRQSAELIFEHYTGLRLPKEALRMVKDTYTDEETGQEVETSTLGVYVIVAGRIEFKPVEVVMEGSDYYVLRPADSGRKILRAGDQVITRATGVYAGQLVKE